MNICFAGTKRSKSESEIGLSSQLAAEVQIISVLGGYIFAEEFGPNQRGSPTMWLADMREAEVADGVSIAHLSSQ